MRLPLVAPVLALALLTGCTDPATPVDPAPAPTTDQPATDQPAADWQPCSDATIAALSTDLEGQLVLAPDDSLSDQDGMSTYPAWLPAPSCIAYPTGQGISVAFFIGATEADVATFESAILEWEGDKPTPVDGIEPPVLVAETWPMGPVVDLRLFDDSTAVGQPYLQVTSVFAGPGAGG